MNVIELMKGFPPPHDRQVTLANWRQPPFCRWAFQHVREIVPSADIANNPAEVWRLPPRPVSLDRLEVPHGDDVISFEDALAQTDTDGIIVLHRGKVAYERYFGEMTPATQHIIMSVSKSVLGLLAGILIGRGALHEDALVTDLIPEIADTAYAGATVRHLLDMRAAIKFDEDYLATSGTIIDYRKATNWNPLEPGEEATDLRSFYTVLTESDGKHEGRFHYVSPNSDLLAWIIERAANNRYADLVSELLWQPMGAYRSAYITVDRIGAPRAAGGLCVTVPDLARIGLLLARNGARDDRQIVPQAWIDDLILFGDETAWAVGDFNEFFGSAPMRYRGQWYVLDGAAPLLFGMGVHGQNLFIDRDNDIVIAKLSSQDLPLDEKRNQLTMNLVAAVRAHLTSLPE